MLPGDISRLEATAGVGAIAGVAAETRAHLASSSGLRLAAQLADHLSAYNATDDVVPFFGDYRLAHTEAYFQLQNSVCLAYHGFYSQAFSTLRSVCELSLLQASLPEGATFSDGPVNVVLRLGSCASQHSGQDASSLEEWAVDGCRTPKWPQMLKRLLGSDTARRFDTETQLAARLQESLASLDPYVHARGYLRSATGLSSGNLLRFSQESLSLFGTRMMCATQLSVAMLLLAFLPTATSHPEAAAGFIDDGDLLMALRVLPSKDAKLLREIYNERDR